MNTELSRLNKLVKKQDEIYHRCAKKAGITDTQFWVLYALCEKEKGLCQNSFCENWCYSKQTVNTAVANLEKAGLVQLSYAEGSHKRKDILLTQQGRAFCRQHIETLIQTEQNVLAALTTEERKIFSEILEKLLNCFEKEIGE